VRVKKDIDATHPQKARVASRAAADSGMAPSGQT
jgi:hypothetical protein